MQDRTIRGKEIRRVTHGHPLGRQGQRAVERVNGRVYEKVSLNGTWYRVPLLRSDELYPPEPSDVIAQREDGIVWDDLRVAASAVRIQGVLNVPDWDNIGGGDLYALAFDDEVMEQVFFTIQMPHNWKEGTDIHPHVHWMTEDDSAGDVRWALEYEWVNIDNAYVSSTIITGDDVSQRIALQHQIADLGDISGIGMTISSMLICRLYRDATAEADDLATDVYLLEFDLHYEIDSLGSRLEYEK